MNILIENAESFKYLDSNSGWTGNALEAMTFPSTQIAFAAAKKEAIGKFNIVGYVAETKQLVNMDHGRGKGVETPGVTPE
jgi:hypothetical protein